MLRTKDIKGNAIAAIAALLLFVQSFGLACQAHGMPVQLMLDQFGNPLCITSGEHGDPAQEQGSAPTCCTMGCASAPIFHAGASDDALSYLIEVPVLISAES